MAQLTEQEKIEAWERGQKALEKIMKYVSIEKIEALAKKVEDPGMRNSFGFKQFIKSL